jgi:DNA invertase Pin-like site-specific DNA recombinase
MAILRDRLLSASSAGLAAFRHRPAICARCRDDVNGVTQERTDSYIDRQLGQRQCGNSGRGRRRPFRVVRRPLRSPVSVNRSCGTDRRRRARVQAVMVNGKASGSRTVEMTSPLAADGAEPGSLAVWAAAARRIRPRRFAAEVPGLRFAFYGRMSTVDYQDRASSWWWQRDSAEDLIAGHGRIAVEFFDEGVSRKVPWPERPQAALLLAAITDPHRGFDAVVVGEYERAFTGQQLRQLTPILRRHGVALWLPETYGPVDFEDPRHIAVIDLLGVRSQREVSRARFRTMAAMRAQAELQGRHLGGRPPYGYRLVDAGPHPNRAHAAWGRRLHRLDPDPATAPHVRWIFEQRLAGHSVASIARQLNERGVPCPSGADPDRNRHRSGGHTSAQPNSSNRPKILYVREDHLLDRIRGNRQLRRQ